MQKTALITGASSGIGKAIATELARVGYNLALVSRNEKKLQQVQRECQATGVQVEIFPFDLNKVEDIASLVEAVWHKLNHLSVLINNAGVFVTGTVDDCDLAMWDRALNINLRAVMTLTKYTLPYIEQNEAGAIINIASIASKAVFAGAANYCATKFGLLGFSGALFEEIREKNIKVCAICPGYVNTAIIDEEAPLDREKMIQPQDIAATLTFVLELPHTACPTEITIMPQKSPYLG